MQKLKGKRNAPKKGKIEKQPATSPHKIEEQKQPRGKDEAEAVLLPTVSRLLDGLHWEHDDPFYAKELSAKQKTNFRSLQWNADEVEKEIKRSEEDIGIQSPKSYLFDPVFASYWKEMRHRSLDLLIQLSNIRGSLDRTILNRRPKLRDRLISKRELRADLDQLGGKICELLEDKEQLSLAIGFCLGLRAYKQELQLNLDRLKIEVMEKFAIKRPETESATGPQRRRETLAGKILFKGLEKARS
jgi:hypothetical protein